MWLALVSAELLAVLAVLALLVGVPILVVAVIAVASGVLQSDIDRQVAARTGGQDGSHEDGSSDPSTGQSDDDR